MDYVITIAHGTIFRFRLAEFLRAVFWPRSRHRWLRPCRSAWELRERSPWLGRRSALHRALIQLGGTGRVRIFPFFWSGRNGVTDRTKAAIRLREQVEARLLRYPSARHFIIAHSHAGNVAFYSIRDSTTIGRQLGGLVCLSTPFLHARLRDQSARGVAWGLVGVIMSIFLAFFLRGFFPASWATTRVVGDTLAVWAGIASFVSMLAIFVVVYRCCRRYSANLLRDHLAFPQSDIPPVFTIRSPGDEASITLGAAEFLLWVSNQLWSHAWSLLGRAQEFARSERGTNLFVISICLYAPAVVVTWLVGRSIDDPLTIALLVPSLAIQLGMLVSMVAEWFWSPLLMLLWAISALCILPFGARLAIASAFLEMNVGWSPPGRSEALLLSDVVAGSGLAHSATYQDERSIEKLVEWIRCSNGEP